MHDLAQAIFESYPSLTFEDPSPPPREASRPFNPDLRPSTDETNIFFREYQPLSVIQPWMRLLQSLFPTHVRMINIGMSYEGRDIPALRVGVHPTHAEKPSGPRKTVIVAGGSHVRLFALIMPLFVIYRESRDMFQEYLPPWHTPTCLINPDTSLIGIADCESMIRPENGSAQAV